MSDYHGDIPLGQTIDIQFTTRAFVTGAPTTLAGTPSVAAYIGNSATEITAGITLSVDHDGRTGLNNVRIVASSGNGYATATDISLVITAGTVGGTSVVGECVGAFSIENRSALRPTVAGRTADITATGTVGIDWGNVENQSTSVSLSATTVATATNVTTVNGLANNVITNASIANNAINDAKVDPDVTIASVTGAVGSVTGNIGGNVTGSVGSIATNGITATSLSSGALTGIEDAIWDAALVNHLDPGSTGAALNAAGAAGDPWTTALPGAYGPGTAGYILGMNLDDQISAVVSIVTTIDSVADAIRAKTDNLTFTVAGQVDSNIQYVNDVQVTGNGEPGTEWGPV